MAWKNFKFLLASTATVAIASQVVKKLYKYFSAKDLARLNDFVDGTCIDEVQYKKEINDVIIFTDDVISKTIRLPPSQDITLCESRKINWMKLIRYIKSARETIDICMYLITSNEIAEQIIKLGQKHVLVRIIVDSEMADAPTSQINILKEFSFVTVQTTNRSTLMHHKFCVIDGPKAVARKNALKKYVEEISFHCPMSQVLLNKPKKAKALKGFVMSGSLNWSTQAMVTNYESVIVTSNSGIVNKFEKEFESIWVEKDPAFSKLQ